MTRTTVCAACGREFVVKSQRMPRCCSRRCRYDDHRARRFLEPRVCGCNKNMTPSPWHCICGRWKRSLHALCERCTLGLVDTYLRPVVAAPA